LPPSKAPRPNRAAQPRLSQATEATSQAVRQATEVLEEQLSAGLAGVRKGTAGLAEERQIDEPAVDEVRERVRSSAHEFIGLAAGRVSDLKADDVQNLAERFAADAHSMFDAV